MAFAQDLRGRTIRSVALDLVDAQVQSTFRDVAHMTSDELASVLRETPEQIVLLDVRTAEEFAVSHLPGAIHVAPDARGAGHIAEQAGGIDGKIVVAYCSIGLRSSRLLVRIGQGLKERGARQLHNLAGGAFRWRNERRALIDANGPTHAIHQYNMLWRQFLVEDPTVVATNN